MAVHGASTVHGGVFVCRCLCFIAIAHIYVSDRAVARRLSSSFSGPLSECSFRRRITAPPRHQADIAAYQAAGTTIVSPLLAVSVSRPPGCYHYLCAMLPSLADLAIRDRSSSLLVCICVEGPARLLALPLLLWLTRRLDARGHHAKASSLLLVLSFFLLSPAALLALFSTT